MVAPGSLEARYEQLTGSEAKRRELYLARSRLRFSIDEWLALPWWQRRVYIEGWQAEADATLDQQDERTGASWVDAIYSGTIADVRATTKFQTG